MISIDDKKNCCGCQACGDVCPASAITYKVDAEGFWYPEVDASKCSQCGLCEKTCPMLNLSSVKSHGQKEPKVYAGHHKNIAIRFESTSGGAFSALAALKYRRGGLVAGAIHNDDFSVSNIVSSSKRDLAKLRSSKYVQSNAQGLYRAIAEHLTAGKKVLACGAPCQMAGLRSYLDTKKISGDNLIVVDFICRANYSPKAYASFIKWLEAEHHSKVVSVKWKNKDHGWRVLGFRADFEDGSTYYGDGFTNPYRRGFHDDYFARPSCYDCQFKGFPRTADITLGDFWGIERVAPELDHNLGTSCILLNTEKGERFFAEAATNMEVKECSIDQVLAGNRLPLTKSVKPPVYNRDEFFTDLDSMPFGALAEKYFPIKTSVAKQSFRRKVRAGLRLLKRILCHPLEQMRVLRWNVLCKNVEADYLNGRVFNVRKYCSMSISKAAKIIIKSGVFNFGNKRNPKSRLETRLLVEDNAVFEIDGRLDIVSGADIQLFKNAHLKIGSGSCNQNLQIVCGDSITIGNDIHIGRDVFIRDTNGTHFIIQPGYSYHNPVVIGDHVWLCSGVKVMKGVTIGEGTVVSAYSVVTHSLPAHCIASGNPAEVVAENIVWRA